MPLYNPVGITAQAPAQKISPLGLFTMKGVTRRLRAMTFPAHTRPIHVTRWRNFRALLEANTLGVTAAAAHLEKSQAQVSQFGGSNPTKIIGDELAAQIEVAFNLSPGALDINGSGDEPVNKSHGGIGSTSLSAEIDEAILAEVEKWVRFEEGVGPRYQPVRRLQRSIALLQILQASGGRLPPEQAAEIIDAARHRQGSLSNGKPAATRGDR